MLTQRTPDERTERIAYEEYADGQHLLLGRCNTKLLGNIGDSHAGERRTHGRVNYEHCAYEHDESLSGLYIIWLAIEFLLQYKSHGNR